MLLCSLALVTSFLQPTTPQDESRTLVATIRSAVGEALAVLPKVSKPEPAVPFLASFHPVYMKNTAEYWMTANPDPTPESLDKINPTMPKAFDRVFLTMSAFEGYRYSNPKRAAELAQKLCDEAERNPNLRLSCLLEVVHEAKIAWLRLQPWPPVEKRA